MSPDDDYETRIASEQDQEEPEETDYWPSQEEIDV